MKSTEVQILGTVIHSMLQQHAQMIQALLVTQLGSVLPCLSCWRRVSLACDVPKTRLPLLGCLHSAALPPASSVPR